MHQVIGIHKIYKAKQKLYCKLLKLGYSNVSICVHKFELMYHSNDDMLGWAKQMYICAVCIVFSEFCC